MCANERPIKAIKYVRQFGWLKQKSGLCAVICICVLLFSAACSKKEEAPSKEEINEKLLAGSESKTWLIVSSTINGIESLPECIEDDHWTFRRSKQVTRQNMTTSCQNSLSDTQTSSWSLGNNGTWLTFFGGTYEILSLTENGMKLEFPASGKIYVDTFVKK